MHTMKQNSPAMSSEGCGRAVALATDGGTGEFSKGLTLPDWFERQADRSPDAVAICCGEQRWTYRDLNRRANRLAHWLRTLGVGPEVLVGLFTERSAHTVVGILGILKAGGAYLPIDPVYPKERVGFMLEDAQVRVILTQRKLLDHLPPSAARVVVLDDPAEAWQCQPETNPAAAATPDHLAYVIYTSGSTGKPKGALIPHYNVVRLFQATEAWFQFQATDVWTFFHSPAFDFSVWEIWGALLYGGRLVVVPYLTSRAPEDFYRLLVQEGVTVLNQTPSAFKQLIAAEERLGPSPDLALRYVIFGGEALAMHSLKPWFDRHGDQRPRLVNMYGITETTVHVTYRPLGAADVDAGSVIGRPIPDLQVYLLGPDQQPVPVNEPGEIYVGGAGVARGYLNRPELTAAKFVPDPFRREPGARLYRSGDLGRRLPNGDIEYLGRIDHQVKIRGFRIELGEIEAALARHAAVRESVVLAQGQDEGTQLVAYVVLKAGASASVGELRALLKSQLPDYMVPARFCFLDRIPLTDNGKIDRCALPELSRAQLAASDRYLAPRSGLEQTIAGIWQAVLGLATVGAADNFFDVGGSSLLAVQVQRRLEEALGRPVPITAIFQYPTISALARHLALASVNGAVEAPGVRDRAARQRAAAARQRAGARPRPRG